MSGKRPKVSVCMRNHNYGHFIGQAVQSVLAQTWADFELIIVDDCSTDGSPEVIERFCDDRIRLCCNQVNLGNVKNLNKCLSLASGEYVAILDSDDMLEPTALEERVAVLEANPTVGLAYTSTKMVDAEGTPLGEFRPFAEDHIVRGEEEFRHLILGNYIYWQTVLLRRKCLDESGGFDERILYSSGWELWLRLALRYDIAYLCEPLLLWRDHGNGITGYFSRTNQVGMEEYKIIKMVFSSLAEHKPRLCYLEREALGALAATMQRRAFTNLTKGNSSLARKNIALAVAIDEAVLRDWKTYALLGASLLGQGAQTTRRLPVWLVRALARYRKTPSFAAT